jgi:hypothetical protein
MRTAVFILQTTHFSRKGFGDFNYMSELHETKRLEVKRSFKILYFIAIWYFAWLAYRMFQLDLPVLIVINLFLSLLSLWFFVFSFTKIDVNPMTIKVSVPHGKYEMAWDEVKSVEKNKKTILFWGNDKAIGYTLMLGGRRKNDFQEYVLNIIQQRQLDWSRPENIEDKDIQKLIKRSKVDKGFLF